MKIKRWLSLVCVFGLFLLPAVNAQAEAKPITKIKIKYEVYKNDIPFAKIEEKLSIKDNAYSITRASKGIGVFALLGERNLKSEGQVASNGLVPSQFTLQQGDRLRKATFDWPKNIVTMKAKGKTRTAELTAGTQDLLSFSYQFRYQPPVVGKPYSVALTTGKKLKQYTYEVETAVIELDGKPVDCLHLFQPNPGKERKEFWIAQSYAYLPIHIVLVDKHDQRLEQTVTSFSSQ